MPQATIDKASKVSVGILGSLIVGIVGGTVYLSTLNTNVIHVGQTLQDVRDAVNENTKTLITHGQASVRWDERLEALSQRVSRLEQR